MALSLALNRAERPAEALAQLRQIEPRLAQAGLAAEHAICQWQIAAAQRILRDQGGTLTSVTDAHVALVENDLTLEAMLCLRDLAVACLGVGDMERAARCILEARTWLKARGLMAEAATFAVTECAQLRGRGQFDEALGILSKAETVFETEELPAELAAVRLYQASIFTQRFETERATSQLQALLPVFETLDLPLRQSMACNELGINAECRADLAAALADYGASLRLVAQLGTRRDQASSLFNLAVVRVVQGELVAAHEQFTEARAVFQQLGDSPAAGMCLVSIGVTECAMGQYGLALRSLEAARQELRAVGVKEYEPNIDHNEGKTGLALGERDLAREHFKNAVTGYQALGANFGAARSLVHVGLIEAEVNHFEAALQLVEQARVIAAATRAAGYLAVCDQVGGEIEIRAGNTPQGLAMLAAAEAAFISLGMPINVWAAAIAQGDGLTELGLNEQAEIRYTAAWRQTSSALPDLAWRSAAGLAFLAERRKQPEVALLWHQRAMSALRAVRSGLGHEMLVDAFLSGRQVAIENAIACALSAGQPEVALDFVEESRAQLLGSQARSGRDSRIKADESGQRLRREIAEIRRKLSGSLEAESSWSILRPATMQQAELLSQLDQKSRAYQAHTALGAPVSGSPPDANHFDLDGLRAALNAAQPRGWTCLAYHWLQGQLLTFVIDDQQVSVTRTTLNPLEQLPLELCMAPEPDRRRAIYGSDGEHRGANQTQAGRQYRALLYRLLIPATVKSQLAPDRVLFVVPAGPLHAQPFQALMQDDTRVGCRHR